VAQCGYGFAYRVLDAQYFGVPQRRRRVFVVGCLGDWRPPAKVLFEPESLRRNLAQSRNKGQGTSDYVESSFGQYRQDVIAGTTKASGGALAGGSETLITTASGKQQFGTLMANAGTKQWLGNQEAFSGDYHILQKVYENHPSDSRVKEMGEVCQTVTSTWGSGGGNIPFVQNVAYEWHNQDSRIKPIQVAATLNCNAGGKEGHLVQSLPIALAENTIGRQPMNGGNGDGFTEGGPMYTLNATGVHGIAQSIGFTQCDAARDAGQNISPTLRSGGDGGYPAHSVAYGFEPGIAKREGNPNRFSEEISPTLRAEMGDNQVSMANIMAVRRLTPVECERLQGFPDNYTNIRENCPDGPRYKAMGNSMAVPVMRWIGERINKVNNEQ
jgi:DNA (cytosine-5)-methyltransferase 1